MKLINGEAIEQLSLLPDKSIDFVYLDLPYGQTGCSWDKKLDLTALWRELKRVAKSERTPFFFSCTTKFGYELIKANEKWFRWDLVWKKNRAAGFLNAYRLPMRKHEMIYCFSKKSPEYDVSSHSEYEEENVVRKESSMKEDLYHNNNVGVKSKTHKIRLPSSDVTPPTPEHELVYCFAKKTPDYDVSDHKTGKTEVGNSKSHVYLNQTSKGDKTCFTKDHTKQILNAPLPTSDITPPTPEHELVYCFAKKTPDYDVSSHKEYTTDQPNTQDCELYGLPTKTVAKKRHTEKLPDSVITPPSDEHELVYLFAKKAPDYDVSDHKTGKTEVGNSKSDVYLNETMGERKGRSEDHTKQILNAPLPTSDVTQPSEEHELVYCFAKKTPEYDVSSHKEFVEEKGRENTIYCTENDIYNQTGKVRKNGKTHKEPLPTSDVFDYDKAGKIEYETYGYSNGKSIKRTTTCHKERLPTTDITPSSWCDIHLDEKTGHRTAKPVALMEFLLKYWTKPGWTVLDPTMGSGSMGIACKKMGREFIGVELDPAIYELAQKRIDEIKT